MMGDYGLYVWPALGLSVAVMGGLALSYLRALGKVRKELAELETRSETQTS